LADGRLDARASGFRGGGGGIAFALREGHYGAILPDIASAELAQADVIALRPAFLRKVERRLVIAWHPRQAETREAIAQAVEAIRQLRAPKTP